MTLEERIAAGDLTGILFEASEAFQAIEHGRSGIRLGIDPKAEAQRIVDALTALEELARLTFPHCD